MAADGAGKEEKRNKVYGGRFGGRQWQTYGDGSAEAVSGAGRKAGAVLLSGCLSEIQIH